MTDPPSSPSRQRPRRAEENDRLARYDQLTGLPNRTLFIEGDREDAVSRSKRQPGTLAVLLIDLDHFTEINNTLGDGVPVSGPGAMRVLGCFACSCLW